MAGRDSPQRQPSAALSTPRPPDVHATAVRRVQDTPAEMFLLDAFRRVFVMQRQQSRLPFPPQPECMLRKMTKAMREQRRIVPEVSPHVRCLPRPMSPGSAAPHALPPCLHLHMHHFLGHACSLVISYWIGAGTHAFASGHGAAG